MACLHQMSDREIEQLYLAHRDGFTAWVGRRFKIAKLDALDLYQEAVVVFVRNVRNGKLDPNACAPATYLYAIGRNLALKRLRDGKETITHDELDAEPPNGPTSLDGLIRDEHDQHLVRHGMARLTEREQEILRLYYFEERSMADIAAIMGYKNADVAKKMKHMSLRKLAELIGKAILPLIALYVERP